jgi:hypothetical protein
MASDMGLSGCAIGTTNIDQFAKMTGIEFHVDGPVGQFAIGRRTNRGLLTDAPLWPGNVLQAMAKGGVSNSDLKFNPQFPVYQDHRRPRASEAPPDATDSKYPIAPRPRLSRSANMAP